MFLVVKISLNVHLVNSVWPMVPESKSAWYYWFFLVRGWHRAYSNGESFLQIEVVPSASALIIKALKEPPRDRKKQKNSEWFLPLVIRGWWCVQCNRQLCLLPLRKQGWHRCLMLSCYRARHCQQVPCGSPVTGVEQSPSGLRGGNCRTG